MVRVRVGGRTVSTHYPWLLQKFRSSLSLALNADPALAPVLPQKCEVEGCHKKIGSRGTLPRCPAHGGGATAEKYNSERCEEPGCTKKMSRESDVKKCSLHGECSGPVNIVFKDILLCFEKTIFHLAGGGKRCAEEGCLKIIAVSQTLCFPHGYSCIFK